MAKEHLHDRRSPQFWLHQARIPERFWHMSLRDYDVELGSIAVYEAACIVDALLANDTHGGVGLTLMGPPGRGKTMIVSILARRHLLRHPAEDIYSYKPPVHFLTLAHYQQILLEPMELERLAKFADDRDAADIAADWRENFDLRRWVYEVPVLVVDDIGKERKSKTLHIEGELDLLLRERFDQGRPTLVTSNLKVEDFRTRYSASMQSFLHEATRVVAVPGEDIRKHPERARA